MGHDGAPMDTGEERAEGSEAWSSSSFARRAHLADVRRSAATCRPFGRGDWLERMAKLVPIIPLNFMLIAGAAT